MCCPTSCDHPRVFFSSLATWMTALGAHLGNKLAPSAAERRCDMAEFSRQLSCLQSTLTGCAFWDICNNRLLRNHEDPPQKQDWIQGLLKELMTRFICMCLTLDAVRSGMYVYGWFSVSFSSSLQNSPMQFKSAKINTLHVQSSLWIVWHQNK